MEYKVETSLWDFPAWSGGKDTLDTLKEKGDVDRVEQWIETVLMESDATDGDINNILWFERDNIADALGYKDWDAYEDGWSKADADDADDWFCELSLEELEEISGYKRDEFRDPDAMIDEGDFVDAVQEWWDGLYDCTRVEIYKKYN